MTYSRFTGKLQYCYKLAFEVPTWNDSFFCSYAKGDSLKFTVAPLHIAAIIWALVCLTIGPFGPRPVLFRVQLVPGPEPRFPLGPILRFSPYLKSGIVPDSGLATHTTTSDPGLAKNGSHCLEYLALFYRF